MGLVYAMCQQWPSSTSQNHWQQHVIKYGWQSLLRIRQLISLHSDEAHIDWLPQRN